MLTLKWDLVPLDFLYPFIPILHHMTTLSELIHLTNITRKQINNRTLPLSKRYPKLIKGGGKGKRGKYFIHPILTRYLTHYKRKPTANHVYYSSELICIGTGGELGDTICRPVRYLSKVIV